MSKLRSPVHLHLQSLVSVIRELFRAYLRFTRASTVIEAVNGLPTSNIVYYKRYSSVMLRSGPVWSGPRRPPTVRLTGPRTNLASAAVFFLAASTMSTKTSKIFTLGHFSKTLDDRQQCTFCQAIYQASTGTSSLKRHLETCKKAPEEVRKLYKSDKSPQKSLEEAGFVSKLSAPHEQKINKALFRLFLCRPVPFMLVCTFEKKKLQFFFFL